MKYLDKVKRDWLLEELRRDQLQPEPLYFPRAIFEDLMSDLDELQKQRNDAYEAAAQVCDLCAKAWKTGPIWHLIGEALQDAADRIRKLKGVK